MNGQVVVHITECPTAGGVTRAIELAIRATPGIRHIVMAPPGTVRTETVGAEFVPLPDGFAARVRALRRLVADVEPAFVHAHSSWAGTYARLGLSTTPVVYQPHTYGFADVTKPAVMRGGFWVAERLLTWRTAAVLALTPHEERQARRLGVRRVHPVVNAPTVSRADVEQRLEQGPADDHPGVMTVAMVGRITAAKDPVFFARIAEAFADDPGVRFLWIGSDDDLPAGQAALERAGVEITGWLADSELTDTLAGVDLYVHTSVFEGFPLSLLDACELGVPSLVRDIPALAECGLPAFSTLDEAVAQIRELIADPAALAELTLRSRELARQRGIDVHDASVRAAYAEHGVVGPQAPVLLPQPGEHPAADAAAVIAIPFTGRDPENVERAVRSVFAQTRSDWHLLLVADNHCPTLVDRLRRIADDRVTVLADDRNLGLAARLNQITAWCPPGVPLTRMDDDDVMFPERMERQLAALSDASTVVSAGGVVIDDEHRVVGRFKAVPSPRRGRDFLRAGVVLHPSVMASQAWFAAHPYDEAMSGGEDTELWMRASATSRFDTFAEPLMFYRIARRLTLGKNAKASRLHRRALRRHGRALVGGARTAVALARSVGKQAMFAVLVGLGRGDIVYASKSEPLAAAERARLQDLLEHASSFPVPGWDYAVEPVALEAGSEVAV